MLEFFFQSPIVQDWQWDLAERIRYGMEQTFGSHPDEVECVKAIVQAIDGAQPVSVTLSTRVSFTLAVEAAFLHGTKSQVSFKIGGITHQRELADLLVLGAYIHNGRLAFQRACLIQAKRSGKNNGQAAVRYGVDPWQLSLLASFPEFTGVAGAFAGHTVHLRNRSGMLGAYGLLSPPGELIVASARVLNQVLGGRKSLVAKELVPAILSESAASRNSRQSSDDRWWFDPDSCPYCHELAMMHGFPHPWRRHLRFHRGSDPCEVAEVPVESVVTCIGLDEFVQCWTGLRLGEVWHAGVDALSDRVLRASLQAVVQRVGSATGKITEVARVMAGTRGDDNRRFNDDNPEVHGRGLGVISVIAQSSTGEG